MDDNVDPAARLRVSDADREHVAEILRTAAGEGRLEMDELEDRLEQAYRARTAADLAPLTADLPSHGGGGAALSVPHASTPASPGTGAVDRFAQPDAAIESGSGFAMMSGYVRNGAWTVPARFTAVAVMGGVDLDLRQARFSARDTEITIYAVMGGVRIIADPGLDISEEGTGIMGGFGSGKARPGTPPAGAPRVRLKGVAFWGGVDVEWKEPRPPAVER